MCHERVTISRLVMGRPKQNTLTPGSSQGQIGPLWDKAGGETPSLHFLFIYPRRFSQTPLFQHRLAVGVAAQARNNPPLGQLL